MTHSVSWTESAGSASDLRQFFKALPKIDLHRHLEGSLRLGTVIELAQEHGVELPSYDIEQLRPLVQVTYDPPDFDRYLTKFHLLRYIYSAREAIERVAYEAVADAAADNIRYLELRFSPSAQASVQGFSFADTIDWVINGVQRAQQDFDIIVRLIIALVRWTGPARLVRSELLKLRELPFVDAARVAGLGDAHILLRELLPNALAPLLVSATFGVASCIVLESSLSFLGLGDPSVASWGRILEQGRGGGAWHLVLAPGLAIFFTVALLNRVAEGLRERMDPRGRW